MKRSLALISLFLVQFIYAQGPGCPNVNAGPTQIDLDCTETCTDLTATFLETGETTSYDVSSIPFNPPENFVGLANSLFVNGDDIFSSVVNLPFTFCFFGNQYTSLVVGANGGISFDASLAGAFNGWNFNQPIPNNTNPTLADVNIFGAVHDIDPAASNGTHDIAWEIKGVAPCRTFVISYFNVAQFSGACNVLKSSQQIVLYEGTNAIDVYILDKPTCFGWNNGNAVIGIQNDAGTVAYVPPGRNTGSWSTSIEAWRFTPNGTPNYNLTWYDGSGTPIGNTPTVNVCPAADETFTAEVEYTNCDGSTFTDSDSVTVTVYTPEDASFTMTATCDGGTATITGVTGGTFAFNPPPSDGAVIDTNTGTVTGGTAGTTYTIEYTTASGCDSTTETVTPLTTGDASFTMAATCDGGTATITGDTGGTFVFNPIPTDGASIDPVTGLVTGGTSGTTYTVEYATTGACADDSTETVTVLAAEDASFTMTANCDGGTATITGDAGGMFAFNPAVTDGAVINAATGEVTSGVPGTTYTIEYTTVGACPETTTQTVTVLAVDDASFTMNANCDGGTATITGDTGGTFTFNPVATDGAVINSTTGEITSGVSGTTYTIEYTTSGACPESSTQTVTVLATGDASFTMTATCDGGTATIVGTTGGTFVFDPVPTDGALINAATGEVTSGVSGTTYTIEYATTGACAASSTETVTVLAAEDATFTMIANCDGGTATITGDTGGVFTFNPTVTDGATINVATGEVTSGVSATTYTVEYTTGGSCPETTTQTVTVLTAEDASFTMNPNCDGGTATITGDTGGTFAFNPAPTDTALINGTTGEVTSGVSGTTYTIEYTTSGACPESSTQTVTVLTTGDASFTMTATCDGGTATIVGTTGGTFVFDPVPTDGALINAATGEVTSGVSGTTYTIEYATTGACAASSTETVTVLAAEDATFTMTANCDGGTATIIGDAGGTFSFNPTVTDGATINAATGEVTSGVSTTTYTIEYTTVSSCPEITTQTVTVLTAEDASFTMIANCDGGTATITGDIGGTFTFNPAPTDTASINGTTGEVTNGTSGATYTIEYTTSGVCPESSIETVTVLITGDASFAMTATCDGGTATITGTTGGGFVFNPVPTDGALIDVTSGAVTSGVSGTTYTIDYTTPGVCAVTSTETVTVLPLEDASFSVIENCDGGIMNIIGNTGGVFSFNPVPTDGAIIDVVSGTVSGGTPATTYVVEYTTGGPCPDVSSQNVTVLNIEDASFSLTPNCQGTTATVNGANGGVFIFSPDPADGSIIDSATGEVTNATYGNTISIQYTTPGVCFNSSIETFNVLLEDDSSFSLAATCDGAIASITGVTGGVFTFNPIPVDGAMINAVTGEVTGGGVNTSYTIEYSTNDICPSTSSQTVITHPLPVVVSPTPLILCDDNVSDGMTEMDLTTKDNEITGGNGNYNVTYHALLADAIAGTPEVLPNSTTYIGTNNEVVFVRVEDAVTGCFDTTTLTLNVVNAPSANQPNPIIYCDPDNDDLGVFDLGPIANQVTTDPALEVTYHLTLQNAIDDVLPQTGVLSNVIGQIIYIRVDYLGVTTDCPTILELELIVEPTPIIDENLMPIILCDDDGVADGYVEFNLTIRDVDVLNSLNPLDFPVTYYSDVADAEIGITSATYIANPNAYINQVTPTQTIGVRVENRITGCYTTTTLDLIVRDIPVPEVTTQALFLSVCDDSLDNDGFAVIDLTENEAAIINGNTDWVVNYFETMADAIANNPIPDYTAYTNASIGGLPHNPQTLIITVTDQVTGCFDYSTLTIEVFNLPSPTPSVSITPLGECDVDNDNLAIFNLQDATIEIDNGEGNIITYHGTFQNADDGVIQLPDTYQNDNNGTGTDIVYVRVENPITSCYTIVELILNVMPTPEVPLNIAPYVVCDDDSDGSTSFDLNTMDAIIYGTQDPNDYTLTYHQTLANAEAIPGISPIVEPQLSNYVSTNTTIYVRLEGVNGCVTTGEFDLQVNPIPVIVLNHGLYEICDDSLDNDGFATFDLTTKDDEITGNDSTLVVSYFESMNDITINNPIPDFTAYTNTSVGGLPHNPQTIFVVVTETTSGLSCTNTTTLTLVVNTIPTPFFNVLTDLSECDYNAPGDLMETFDLTINEIAMSNAFDETVTYYTDPVEAENGMNSIPNPLAYINTNPTETIYVRVTKTGDPMNPLDFGTGCYTIGSFQITVNPLPDVTAAIPDIVECEMNTDGVFEFDLTVRDVDALNGQSDTDFDVFYYASAADLAANSPIADPTSFENILANPQEIFISITNTLTTCFALSTNSFFIEVHNQPMANSDMIPLVMQPLCDDNMEFDNDTTNDSVEFDILSIEPDVLDGLDPIDFPVTYYESLAEAEAGNSAIPNPATYTNITNPQVIYIRIDDDTSPDNACYDITSITLTVNPMPSTDILDEAIICVDTNGTEVLDAPILDTGLSIVDYSFEWTEAGDPMVVLGTDATYLPTQGGTYSVFITNIITGCTTIVGDPNTISVITESAPPTSLTLDVTTIEFANNHTIEATVVGNSIDGYEFSIDDGGFNSNGTNTFVFDNVSAGEHIITVRDITGCGELSDNVFVIDYPLFFTPNNDGHNDTWQIAGINPDAKIYIFDRYGKLLKQLSPSSTGWDGTLNGQPLPSSDYWFSLEYKDPSDLTDTSIKEFRAHFTLKR